LRYAFRIREKNSVLLFVAQPMFLKVTYIYGTLGKGSFAARKKIGEFYTDWSPYVDPGGNAVQGGGDHRHWDGEFASH
jgi:hypothetical protein